MPHNHNPIYTATHTHTHTHTNAVEQCSYRPQLIEIKQLKSALCDGTTLHGGGFTLCSGHWRAVKADALIINNKKNTQIAQKNDETRMRHVNARAHTHTHTHIARVDGYSLYRKSSLKCRRNPWLGLGVWRPPTTRFHRQKPAPSPHQQKKKN